LKVSVIIPNHGRDISKLLDSLPKDDSVEVIHVNEGKERSEQRNIGIDRATGDAFLFLDSDQSISIDLINECVDLIRAGYSSVYIPEVIVADSLFGKVRKFEREFYTGTAVDVPRFVIRSACPRFDVTLHGPEDSDWGNRIPGHRAISKNVLYHHDNIRILEYFKKKSYYAKSLKRYKSKWPHDKVLDWKWRCFGVFIEDGKWKKALRHPLLFIYIYLIIFVRGVIYIKS
jgi:glycosyltransferase involved in cell wall biosynthesis